MYSIVCFFFVFRLLSQFFVIVIYVILVEYISSSSSIHRKPSHLPSLLPSSFQLSLAVILTISGGFLWLYVVYRWFRVIARVPLSNPIALKSLKTIRRW